MNLKGIFKRYEVGKVIELERPDGTVNKCVITRNNGSFRNERIIQAELLDENGNRTGISASADGSGKVCWRDANFGDGKLRF